MTDVNQKALYEVVTTYVRSHYSNLKDYVTAIANSRRNLTYTPEGTGEPEVIWNVIIVFRHKPVFKLAMQTLDNDIPYELLEQSLRSHIQDIANHTLTMWHKAAIAAYEGTVIGEEGDTPYREMLYGSDSIVTIFGDIMTFDGKVTSLTVTSETTYADIADILSIHRRSYDYTTHYLSDGVDYNLEGALPHRKVKVNTGKTRQKSQHKTVSAVELETFTDLQKLPGGTVFTLTVHSVMLKNNEALNLFGVKEGASGRLEIYTENSIFIYPNRDSYHTLKSQLQERLGVTIEKGKMYTTNFVVKGLKRVSQNGSAYYLDLEILS